MKILLIIAVSLFLGSTVFPQTEGKMEITVNIGSTENVGGTAFRLKFVEVLEESRCPEGVDCIWAGNARIKIEVSNGDTACNSYELETNGPAKSVDFEGFRIFLKSVDPYPKVDMTIDSSDYKATFTVDEAEPQDPAGR